MTFTVRWIQSALDELATLWMSADSGMRTEINRATQDIDRQALSESRDPGEWVFFAAPLGVLFEFEPATRVVWVLSVWRYR